MLEYRNNAPDLELLQDFFQARQTKINQAKNYQAKKSEAHTMSNADFQTIK